MASIPVNIFQLKISLKHFKRPSVWRRVLVPENYTFFRLHEVIQVVMPWNNCHSHKFSMVNPKTGNMTEILSQGTINAYKSCMSDDKMACEKMVTLSEYFSSPGAKAEYIYDLGDSWDHIIVLEKVLPSDGRQYPLCVGGRTICPKEDGGGYYSSDEAYEEFLEKEKEAMKTVKFNPKSVDFSRLETLFDLG